MRNPSWSCALLATSFWNTPSTPCARRGAAPQGMFKRHPRTLTDPTLLVARPAGHQLLVHAQHALEKERINSEGTSDNTQGT